MAKTKQQKQEDLKKLEDKISKAKSLVFIGYDNVKITDQDKLRRALKKEKSELLVAKKTIIRVALQKLKIKNSENLNLEKEIAVAFGYEDEVSPARIVAQTSRLAKNIKIKGGLLDKEIVDATKMIFLSSLPSKEILQANFLRSLQSPLSGLVNVLQGNLRGLVCLFKAMAEKGK